MIDNMIPPRPDDPEELIKWKLRYFSQHYGMSDLQFYYYVLSTFQLSIGNSTMRPHKPIPKQGKEEKVSRMFGLPKSTSDTSLYGWRTWRLNRSLKYVNREDATLTFEFFEGEFVKSFKEQLEGYYIKQYLISSIDDYDTSHLLSTQWKEVESRSYILSAAHVDACHWYGPVMTVSMQNNGKLKEISLHNKALIDKTGRGDYGVYSYKTIDLLLQYHGIFDGVLGKVEMPVQDQVIEHEDGYRAQKVIISELFVFDLDLPDAFTGMGAFIKESLEERYQCPVHRFENWGEFILSNKENENV